MTLPYEMSLMAARRVSPRIHAVPAPKTSLLRFIDAVDAAVVLTSVEGRVTTLNGSARDFFVGRVGAQLRDLVEGAVRAALGDRRRTSIGAPNPTRHFEVGHERIVATVVLAGADVAGHDIGAMVMLRREAPRSTARATEPSLVQRFGLTPQEARVALMLADQLSNRDVAARLGVSVHTARHHTERVLAKLQIHSRYDVRRAIT